MLQLRATCEVADGSHDLAANYDCRHVVFDPCLVDCPRPLPPCRVMFFSQDERVRLSEQLAAVMAELRQATEANRQRQELNNQVSHVELGCWPMPWGSVLFAACSVPPACCALAWHRVAGMK